ncbi:neutral/alkaline non-lysosomal ceramidase N-terminal domain-containing protein [Nocardia rosealba]|uniref:neutral/alkaline non-lysosomal ceramidase N-terminal domain-containing protein n=1 Tax=Nocardia rosealba TaxID=2878563 RepID=UPI001CDA3D47|nr:neutral/alkaline ceramidase [Nocardia rosealba]MCA2210008.1 neutral/alkaline ceramidase [Nocardia rosealba]
MPVNRRAVLAASTLGIPLVAAMGAHGASKAHAESARGGFEFGLGIADLTGPAAECGMMGYSQLEQTTAGIHLRPRARAFVIESGGNRVAFVAVENGALFQSVHRGVLLALARRFGDRYTERNVVLTSTHTHSSCGGSAHDYAYTLATLGFQQQVYDTEVDGIVEAIAAADADLAPGTVALGRAELRDASVNRSRVAFDRNPAEDRAAFPDAIDPAVTTLVFRRGAKEVGALTWFATHNTSMTNKNRLISSDNKGYASYAAEHLEHGVRHLDGEPSYLAAFVQTNAGDMSPNLALAPGIGPTDDEFDNTRIIGERQYIASRTAAEQAAPITSTIDSLLCYVDLAAVTVDGRFTPDGAPHRTAPAAAGLSLAAGSVEDGPGLPGGPIPEGVRNPLVDFLGGIDHPHPAWLADAQAPKAIFAPLGLMPPVPWVPNVVPLQLIRLGDLYVAAAGAEFTIVAGLRVRRAVAQALGVGVEQVLLQGYSNAYHQYVTTPEEYDAQQYEGASTLFGRYTLCAYVQEFTRLAEAFVAGAVPGRGPAPRDVSALQPNFAAAPGPDATPSGRNFGDVVRRPERTARGGRVEAEFVSAHPKHNPRRGGTFLEVQRRTGNGWVRVANEGEWDVRFYWRKQDAAVSIAHFVWDIPAGAEPGTHRFVHFADALGADGVLRPFTGTSDEFEVV